MPATLGTEEIENNVFRIYEDDNNDIIIEHKSSGTTSVLVTT